jgi:hypothetical protein
MSEMSKANKKLERLATLVGCEKEWKENGRKPPLFYS